MQPFSLLDVPSRFTAAISGGLYCILGIISAFAPALCFRNRRGGFDAGLHRTADAAIRDLAGIADDESIRNEARALIRRARTPARGIDEPGHMSDVTCALSGYEVHDVGFDHALVGFQDAMSRINGKNASALCGTSPFHKILLSICIMTPQKHVPCLGVRIGIKNCQPGTGLHTGKTCRNLINTLIKPGRMADGTLGNAYHDMTILGHGRKLRLKPFCFPAASSCSDFFWP